MPKILIVDDDINHNTMVSAYLGRENFVTETATSADEAMSWLSMTSFDVIVLDWNLPDASGIELLKWYRARGETPVLMLTAKGTIDNRAEGLDSGADDYLLKPFSVKELVARLRALLRRAPLTASTLTAGRYVLDPKSLTARKLDTEIRLTQGEFALLEFFARHPDEIFTAEALIARVWRADTEITTDAVRATLKRLRSKLDDLVIETVPGAGYKLGAS